MSNLAEKRKVLAFPDGSTLQEKEVVVADIENGYTRVANAIMEALCKTKLSDREHRVLFAVMRKTFGYQQSSDWICLEQFEELTGILKRNVSTTLKTLLNRKILIKDGKRIAVNTTLSDWLNKEITLETEKNKNISKPSTETLETEKDILKTENVCTRNRGPQKKDTYTKETIKDNYVQNVRSSLPEVSNPVFIDLPLKDGTAHQVTTDEINYYKELYPITDIEQSLRSMLGWLNANVAKRKTKKGIKTFITGWLNRENKNTVQYRQEVASNQAPDFHKCDLSWADDLGW